ncbi:HD domain-containing protein [Zunongwangia sp. F363]|uniref:HD domain-containing protein n=1 Tax=Autumnicola tepida TaxID=3075595 RepID=A0ABU3C703_9FLAO|nr:HD domain-containing protein [Zunongwangia sp. F363]MDT0642091.1 HD domain-containing protein [Zunongwangia sp. F363]
MTTRQPEIIENTIAFVKETLKNAEGGHDWFHIQRVYNNAKLIAKGENADDFVVALGALLHDIADSKFHNGDESVGPKMAKNFLQSQQVSAETIEHVVKIIENISFKGGNVNRSFSSPELDIVQDADRIDALGAIGIARTFNYGGYKGRGLYDPEIKPNFNMTKEEYKASNAPTINHFYEKLLLLKDRMNTESGRKIANKRHQFMKLYLEQFYKEWHGEA